MWSTEVSLARLHDFPAYECPDLKPENLLYLTRDEHSSLVLADFGIAKMLDSKSEVLTTMAGSFGYAAPEVMLKKGHGKPVDMWSMGVITYTLLCGYSPFRSENLADLIEECKNGRVIFHERYWKEVSKEAKEFITQLLQPDPNKRPTSKVMHLDPLVTTTCYLRSVRTLQRPASSAVSSLSSLQTASKRSRCRKTKRTIHQVRPTCPPMRERLQEKR
jgi:serine/threonine protein kinase